MRYLAWGLGFWRSWGEHGAGLGWAGISFDPEEGKARERVDVHQDMCPKPRSSFRPKSIDAQLPSSKRAGDQS